MHDDPVLQSLQCAVDNAGDITPEVYRRYYAACPSSATLMSHVDEYMQGRMMDEVYRLVMTDPAEMPVDYLTFETRNHAGWGVRTSMYASLLDALHDTVRAAAGDQWTAEFERAWTARLTALQHAIEQAAPSAGATGD